MSRDVEGLMGMRDAAIIAANNAHMHGYELGKQDGLNERDMEWQTRQLDLETLNLNRMYEQGQRDAIAAAVQRVEALAEPTQWRPEPRKTARISDVIAAIKGDQP